MVLLLLVDEKDGIRWFLYNIGVHTRTRPISSMPFKMDNDFTTLTRTPLTKYIIVPIFLHTNYVMLACIRWICLAKNKFHRLKKKLNHFICHIHLSQRAVLFRQPQHLFSFVQLSNQRSEKRIYCIHVIHLGETKKKSRMNVNEKHTAVSPLYLLFNSTHRQFACE